MIETVTFCEKLFFFSLIVLRARKKKLALTFFCYVSREIWLGNSKNLICIDLLRFYKNL